MDKQTTIAFILIGAILVLWLYITAPDPNQQTKPKSSSTQLSDTLKDNSTDTISVQQPRETINNDVLVKKIKQDSIPEVITVIETELARFELSNKGGNFKKIFLKKFNNWYSANKKGDDENYLDKVQLINYSTGGSYDLSFVSVEGHGINTKDYTFQSNLTTTNIKLNGTDSLQIDYVLQLESGKSITKTFTFFADKYEVKSDIIFSGLSNSINSNSFDLVWENGIRFVEKNSVDEATYSNASVYYGDEQVIVNTSSPGEKEVKEFRGKVDWLAVRNKYFAVVIIPDNPQKVEGAYIEGMSKSVGKDGLIKLYNARLTLPFQNKAEEKQSFTLFIGPVDYKELESYGKNLVAIVDFGSFFGLKFIVRPIAEYLLLPLFLFINSIIPNYGIVLIIFSIIIKVAVYPLTKTSFQSMKKMQALQPMIAELKEKYKDDPQKMNKETMKLYSTYGINPAGGCLPMLLQMPIFIALWGLFKSAIDLRQQPFFGWITDLSQPDVIYNIGFKIPIFGISEISGLALLMGITTFIQQKMTVKDPKQQALIYMMPIMLTLLFMSFPSGLNLYYFMFNLLTIIQQYYINHKGGKVELVPVANPKKKKGFMSKLMEAAEEQAKTQQKKRK
ncbi:MAG TPA: membrane protein insertase YidC [Ignavibacteriaceae bacterium]|jgi:YidC/Oxa1 family membrane protein insertase|nr:MAG: Membrane protein insertase YidC [Ignavibacteria bacterium ADurb.Bin266]OQY73983.1 MAG: preprotein translocase YidC [Ignavibacteriales bacterium UTCHB2]HQF41916.1 membrane protein insertase YidC [Ignavibacteriaceae bacterium]HQI40155.1 membrane protein insertase YidC [Ignavibacteriaceae bacterium]HQJ45897.1 membrane protein insertase YidC [Ignavibacteriaceae bacterium]